LAALIAGLAAPLTPTTAYAIAIPSPISPLDDTFVSATGHQEPGHSAYLTAAPLAIPQFTWAPVAGTKNYRVQFSQNIGFSPIALEVTTTNTNYSPTQSEKFPDGNLYWRVRVDAPLASNYTDPLLWIKDWASPDNAPGLIGPSDNGSIDFFNQPVFSWQPVTGAARYRFQIAASAGGFSSPLVNLTTQATSHQPISKLTNGEYFWRVIPLDPNDREGTTSEIRKFSLRYGLVDTFPVEIPSLIEPAHNSFPVFTPTFRWSAVRGAQFYRLEYTTDPTCNFGLAGYTTSVETRNTTYTPTSAFPNDVNYCWRVRAHSDKSISDWSSIWKFEKRWYIKPVLLTPTNLYQQTANPYLSWTPVPGASRYKVEMNWENQFPVTAGGPCRFTEYAANTHYVHMKSPGCIPAPGQTYHWRITPVDRNNNEGKPSNVSSFVGGYDSPQLVYPQYHYSYPPATYPGGSELNPAEDRTVPVPIFMWHRLLDADGVAQAAAYQVEVNAGNPFLDTPEWIFQTENLSAVPTGTFPFTPASATTDYFWRVCPLTALGGSLTRECSQVWKTRIDLSKGLPPTGSLTLLRPAMGAESADTAPLLEWWPLLGADSYEVQISVDPSFTAPHLVDSATVPYPAYTPRSHLDYYPEFPADIDFGTYYWRVRGLSGGSPLGWSAAWRFQVAAQSNWRVSRTLGSLPSETLQLAYDPAGEAPADYDLTNLYTAETGGASEVAWYFGFNIPSTDNNTGYVLYLDQDHKDGSGASTDANGYQVTAVSHHLPEFAIYVFPSGGTISAANIWIYGAEGGEWGFPVSLSSVGGTINYSAPYLELKVPATAINMEGETGSAAVALFSVHRPSGLVQDTVPSGSNLALNRFASVTGLISLAMPASNLAGDPTTLPSTPLFSWHFPVNIPWFGYNIQVGVDPSLTSWLYDLKAWGSSKVQPNFSANSNTNFEFQGDNTYYWRVRPLYYAPAAPGQYITGAWSQVGRYDRQGFIPQNLSISVSFATPTFSWDRVEGADGYDIEVDNDPNFGTPEFGTVTTAQTSYTPVNTLANGTYYWRVRARRYNNLANDWVETAPFTLSLPKPSGLTPNNPDLAQAVNSAPTLCWNPIDVSVGGVSTLTAWKYKVQVRKGSATGPIYDSISATEQTCWTPTKGFEDGTYFWEVAMIEGCNNISEFSTPAQFTKQYPAPALVSPLNGSQVSGPPTFIWRPVNGAAAYKLEISLYNTFSPIYDSATTNNTSYTPVKAYETGKTYYWRIALVDKDGRTGPFSDATILYGGNGAGSGSGEVFLPLLIRR
jgi:hypothetical protein